MKRCSFSLIGLVLALCIFGASGLSTLDVYSNTTGKYLSPSYTQSWPGTTTTCQIETISGQKEWTIEVTDASVNWGGCGVYSNTTIDISGYTELEIIAFLDVVGGANDNTTELVNFQIELQDSDGNSASLQIELTEQVNDLIFPVANFQGIDLTKAKSFIINIFNMNNNGHVRKAAISRFRFNQRTIYRVFTDAIDITTTPPSGPGVLYSWGDIPCNPFTQDNSAPEGSLVLSIPAGSWGCGLLNVAINVGTAKSLLFWLRSNTDILFELTDNYGHKGSFTIPSTKNVWTKETITADQMTGQGLDLTCITYQFMVTKIGSATPTARLDNIRFSYV